MSIIEKEGLILSGKNGLYRLETEDGIYTCRCGTKIRKTDGRILAGDRVIFRDNGENSGFITDLLPRRNYMVRPPVANIDLLAVVVAPKDPSPYLYNVDLLSVIAEKHGIECVIIISKSDLSNCREIKDVYSKTPFRIIETSSESGIGIADARDALKGKICVLCGASGVGKSSLLNSIYPSLGLETGELSLRISRGKNTTRTTELFPMGDGTYLADTPGFTAVNTELYCAIDHKELHNFFPEFSEHTSKCRYADCTHTKEEECGISYGVSHGLISAERHESYKKLYDELKSIDRYK